MEAKCILFDLDGTITDSGEGIIKSAIYMLEHFGLPAPPPQELRWIVGPPLRVSFPKLGILPEQIEEAVAVYRGRYIPIGLYENALYPGIRVLLEALLQDGHRLFIATSKPQHMAVTVLEHFGIAHLFERIGGAVSDKTRDSKSAVIESLLSEINHSRQTVMVGDTAFDVVGAAQHDIPTVGVAWGYGAVEDMVAAGAASIAHTMEELYQQLSQ